MAIEKMAYAFERMISSPSGRRVLAETGKALIPAAAAAGPAIAVVAVCGAMGYGLSRALGSSGKA